MKPQYYLLLLFAVLDGRSSAMAAVSAPINWGSPVDSVLRDSSGLPLDGTYVVQLGYFESGPDGPFVPSADNAADWAAHWMVFDQAAYDPQTGYFTSSARVLANGGSSSPFASVGMNFADQPAYLWIYNTTTPGPETQWFLGRNSGTNGWTLPSKPIDCCDNLPPISWSISDFDSADVPVYGKQGNTAGDGEHTDNGIYDIQTFTFLPEPTVALLAVSGSLALVLRRRRTAGN